MICFRFIIVNTSHKDQNRDDDDDGINNNNDHEVKELQKTAILGTAHIRRKLLM
jgi:porphobilinogen deaminase